MSATTPAERAVVLAKVLALGEMAHREAAEVCGWGYREFRAAAAEGNRAGLLTWAHRGGVRVYRTGKSDRCAGRRAA